MEQKKWWKSKTIWGIFIAALGYVISNVLAVPDVSVPENADFEQLKQYAQAVKEAHGNISQIISAIMSAVGTVIAIIGRIQAGEKLTA
jgi:hypothetical protein